MIRKALAILRAIPAVPIFLVIEIGTAWKFRKRKRRGV